MPFELTKELKMYEIRFENTKTVNAIVKYFQEANTVAEKLALDRVDNVISIAFICNVQYLTPRLN